MDKLFNLLKKLGIELSADQTEQVKEVIGKEFVAAEDAAKRNTELEELKKQLADRDKDLEKLKSENKSGELAQKLAELEAKYKTDTDNEIRQSLQLTSLLKLDIGHTVLIDNGSDLLGLVCFQLLIYFKKILPSFKVGRIKFYLAYFPVNFDLDHNGLFGLYFEFHFLPPKIKSKSALSTGR